MWEELRACKLIEQNRRTPVPVTTYANPPPVKEFSKLFEPQIACNSDVQLTPVEAAEAARRKV